MKSPKDMLSIDMYYKAIEGSDSGLWVLDLESGICYLSNRYYTMLGYEPDEFEGTMKKLFSLLHPDDVEKSTMLLSDYLEGRSEKYRNEVRLKNKSGEYQPILTQGQVERDSNGKPIKFIGWNIDITLLKEAQKKLDDERAFNAAQSRLAQLGLLSSGLAHEVNNPLTVIQMRSEILLRNLKNEKEVNLNQIISGLEGIQGSANRIAEIVKGLRTIADGGNEGYKAEISLVSVVDEVINMCRGGLKDRNINLHLKFPDQTPLIFGNFALLSQVFINLINNACDALESNSQKDIWINVKTSGSEVIFIIDDNGSGIRPEDRDKIMLPFFTTKEPGKGTGLGLSISKSIVQSQSGTLNFEAMEGKTRFTVTLPSGRT